SQLAREPDRELAMGVMDKLVESRQDDPYALFAQAHLAMRQARFEMALNTLDDALKIKPNWSSAIILRSRILAMQGARAEALSYLEGVLDGDMSDNLEIGLTYARMLTEARQLDKALDEFIRLAEIDERNAEINYYAGVLALQLKKLDEAQTYLEKVLKLGKRVQETNYYLGQVAEQRNDLRSAMNRYSFVRHGEFYFSAQLRMVSILAEKQEYDGAIEQLQTVRVNSAKQRLQLILLEGDLLREAQRYSDAKNFYTKVLNSMPNETSVRYARALVAEKLGDLDLLESDLNLILEQEPTNAQVLNALGYTLADRTNRYEEALQYIQRAMELEPDDAAVVDSMGWVYYRLGDYNQAIKHLRRANELSQDPEIAAHLGEVLWVSGDQQGALEIWENALKQNPDDKVLIDVMQRFGL
ncbi:MAG: tetratricopeptide repeat protein, partial [Gammaproteobacteria bacterium]